MQLVAGILAAVCEAVSGAQAWLETQIPLGMGDLAFQLRQTQVLYHRWWLTTRLQVPNF